MGLYDRDKIAGDILVDVGSVEEAYEGLSIDLIHAHGKLILRDAQGIFGNPTADSKRTSITAETEHLLAIFFTPPEIPHAYLEQTLDYLKTLYAQEAPGAAINISVVRC
jgi:DNA/RNA-binding domain of Phe-tRNA-synthetase-like protein